MNAAGLNPTPIQELTCGCCSGSARGRQWWNQDQGYGLCDKCINLCVGDAAFSSAYGHRGIHWGLAPVEDDRLDGLRFTVTVELFQVDGPASDFDAREYIRREIANAVAGLNGEFALGRDEYSDEVPPTYEATITIHEEAGQ